MCVVHNPFAPKLCPGDQRVATPCLSHELIAGPMLLHAALIAAASLARPTRPDSGAMMRSGLSLRPAATEGDGPRVVIVSLKGRVHHKSRAELANLLPGAVIGNYVAHDSFAVLATRDHVVTAGLHPAVAFVGALDAEHKISPSLLAEVGRRGARRYAPQALRATRALVRLWPSDMRVPSRPLKALLSQWRGAGSVLERAEGIKPEPEAQGFTFSLPVSHEAAEQLLRSLAAVEAVKWVEAAAQDRQMNAHAKPVLRGDHWDGGGIEALGLTGKGEVVGVTDSGIDVDHCFFWDEDEGRLATLPTNTSTSRKIKSYWPVADAADERDGHGTHVVGSILGNFSAFGQWAPPTHAAGVLAQYGGMAPGARVAFTDVGLAVFQEKSAKGDAFVGRAQFKPAQLEMSPTSLGPSGL